MRHFMLFILFFLNYCFVENINTMQPNNPLETTAQQNPQRSCMELFQAISNRNESECLRIIARLNHILITWPDEYGCKPMHYAACFLPEQSALKVIKALIDRGENCNSTDNSQKTPAHYAMETGKFNLVKYLVKEMRTFLIKDSNGNSLMDIARKTNNNDMLTYFQNLYDEIGLTCATGLFPYGFFFKFQNIAYFYTDLYCGLTWRIKNYLDQFPEHVNITIGETQRTPLHYIAMASKNIVQEDLAIEIIEYLLLKGANPRIQDAQRRTPMHYAAENGSLVLMIILATDESDLDTPDHNQETPTSISVRCKFINTP